MIVSFSRTHSPIAAVVAGFAGEKRSWGGGSVDPGDAERGVAATLGAEGEIITGYRRRSHVATHPIVAVRRRGLRLAWFGRRKVTLEQVRERVRSAPAPSLGNVLCFKVECRDGLEAVRGACVRCPSVEKLGAGEGREETPRGGGGCCDETDDEDKKDCVAHFFLESLRENTELFAVV